MKNEKKLFKSGERIITRGDEAAAAYLILRGKVTVTLDREGRQIKIGELESGAIFGETALINDGSLYTANVDAAADTELAVITPESFADKIGTCDPMLRALLEMLVERLRKTNEALLHSETREFMDIAFL
jgi:CRP-like cAMP-binding protein